MQAVKQMNNNTGVTKIFKRYEMKYLVNDQQRDAILKAMEGKMSPDKHGRSLICNLYYDTPDYLLIRRSIEKPVFKEKLRLRSYGTPDEDSIVFMEIKRKYRDVVYKRRISLMEGDVENFALWHNFGDSQIAKEINYFFSYYRDLKPRVYLAYDRQAFYLDEDDDFRLTIDDNIRYRHSNLTLQSDEGCELLLPPGLHLIELKTSKAIPLWLADTLTRDHIYKASISKYGTVYRKLYEENGGMLYE